MILPTPECPYGFPDKQLRKIFTREQYQNFFSWMRGQTFTDCDGWKYDPSTKSMEHTECFDDPHGYVFYTHDVAKYAKGSGILD